MLGEGGTPISSGSLKVPWQCSGDHVVMRVQLESGSGGTPVSLKYLWLFCQTSLELLTFWFLNKGKLLQLELSPDNKIEVIFELPQSCVWCKYTNPFLRNFEECSSAFFVSQQVSSGYSKDIWLLQKLPSSALVISPTLSPETQADRA